MRRRIMLFAGLVGLILPATASAAQPVVRTGGSTSITTTTAIINGTVDANRAETTYHFEYGPTLAYGATTAPASAGARGRAVAVSAEIISLAPGTRYHYRLVARNRDGVDRGADRVLRTRNEPLGLSLEAVPNPVTPPGAPTQLVGRLSGTNNAGRQVILQGNPFPYTQGFLQVGNPLVTDAAGNFSFPILSLPISTQFRVVMPQRPDVASPIVTADAAVRVRAAARKVARHRSSVSVRFRGSVLPPSDGVRVNIQKRRAGQWVTIAHTRARHASARRSRYELRVRVFRSGRFRVRAEAVGAYSSGASRTIAIRVRR